MIRGLREIIISFPVYRTYSGPGGVSPRDQEILERAVRTARRRNPAVDLGIFESGSQILLWKPASGSLAQEQLELFVGRFQQVTSPIMAKGVEDTAFYRYVPPVSVNEVGAHPPTAAVSIEQLHTVNIIRARQADFTGRVGYLSGPAR